MYTYKHLIEFAKNHWQWEKEFAPNNTNHGLSRLYIEHAGKLNTVVLNNHKMFSTPPLDKRLFKEDFLALERMIKKLQSKKIRFYFVAEPYRQYMIDKYDDIRITREEFIHKTKKITLSNGGKFIDLHKKLHLNDDYFADREHLNSKGSVLTAKEVGIFIDAHE